jgi:hypothetical protein
MDWWFIIIVVAFNILNLVGGLILIKKFKFVPSAIFIGKVAAVSIMITFLLNILMFNYIQYFYYLSVLLLIISFIQYCIVSYKSIFVDTKT